jgi:hypothetical protein
MLWIWASIPMGSRVVGGDCDGVNTADQRHVQAARLVQAAQDFRDAAARPGASLAAAPATVAPLGEALQEINAGWYRLAAAAAPRIATRRRLLEIQADARAGSLSRSRRSASPLPCTTPPLPAPCPRTTASPSDHRGLRERQALRPRLRTADGGQRCAGPWRLAPR